METARKQSQSDFEDETTHAFDLNTGEANEDEQTITINLYPDYGGNTWVVQYEDEEYPFASEELEADLHGAEGFAMGLRVALALPHRRTLSDWQEAEAEGTKTWTLALPGMAALG